MCDKEKELVLDDGSQRLESAEGSFPPPVPGLQTEMKEAYRNNSSDFEEDEE